MCGRFKSRYGNGIRASTNFKQQIEPMLMKDFLKLLFLIFFTVSSNAQLSGKSFVFSSVYKDSINTIEIHDSIRMQFNVSGWIMQKSQNELLFHYYSNSEDIEEYYSFHPLESEYTRFIKNRNKRDQGKKRWKNYTVYDSEELTGYVENDSLIWMHSPRNNQYAKCQVAPLFEVHKNQLTLNSSWTSRLIIFKAFPNNQDFQGNLDCSYVVNSKKEIIYNNKEISCWEIIATGTHVSLGASKTTFLYNETYGLVQITYHFYDGSSLELMECSIF